MNNYISSNNIVTTTSASDVQISELTATLPRGVYLVMVSVNIRNSASGGTNSTNLPVSIYQNNVQVPNSQRFCVYPNNLTTTLYGSVSTQCVVRLNSTQVVEARGSSPSSTTTWGTRSIIFVKIAD